ncbi:hypothetical protein E2C01_031501 [Portunus trituberculatus]|uniref:Uncharacterized protein n=1 Tax=Portunus trituberculatus TaxID=210409 RepID=A0A5B7EYQ9_PORTR|nr:hypothetical protein [Portunus trituberculatus]
MKVEEQEAPCSGVEAEVVVSGLTDTQINGRICSFTWHEQLAAALTQPSSHPFRRHTPSQAVAPLILTKEKNYFVHITGYQDSQKKRRLIGYQTNVQTKQRNV